MNTTRGKHMKRFSLFKPKGKHAKEYNNIQISIIILKHLSIILLICLISGTSAFFIIKNSIENMFIIGELKPEIVETFDVENKTKSDVYIKNSGNVPIYLRASIIIFWKDSQGKVLEIKPEENVDYLISFSTSTNWVKYSDGYYYYKNILAENDNTDVLIEECVQIKEYEDKILEVSIAVQAIQAEPPKAIKEAWNIETEENQLLINN